MGIIDTYSSLPESFFTRSEPYNFNSSKLLMFNEALGDELGVSRNQIVSYLKGENQFDSYDALSLAYSGHQFGHFNPTLGDGRAHIIAEINSQKFNHVDIQLKGSGKTPYSRRGDGRSALGPVIREYIVSEAMYNLNIPTTRALASFKTNENVYRDEPEPGGVFARVAKSHLRVGSFEYFASREKFDELKLLADYAINRHYSDLSHSNDKYLDFFISVAKNKIKLVSEWMGLGFIHGVMNTDNTSICGITIDYGPCAFLDEYKSNKVFSYIDKNGRYSYSNQMEISLWNMSAFASSLVSLLKKENEKHSEFIERIQSILLDLELFSKQTYLEVMCRKIGIIDPTDSDIQLINEILDFMEKHDLDFTNTFRNLETISFPIKIKEKLLSRQEEQVLNSHEIKEVMNSVNPFIIPRNHQVQKAIDWVYNDDYSYYELLVKAYSEPYKYNVAFMELTTPPTKEERVVNTFCGT